MSAEVNIAPLRLHRVICALLNTARGALHSDRLALISVAC